MELRVRFLAGHLAGVEEDFAADFDAQLPAIESEPHPEGVTARDRERARLLSEQLSRTREALDAVV